MSQTIVVIAAVLDQYKLTLYAEDGSTHEIKQRDARLEKILLAVMPFIQDGQSCEINLGQEVSSAEEFRLFEKQLDGAIQFLKVAKSKIKLLFGFQEEQAALEAGKTITYGKVPTNNPGVKEVRVGRKDGKEPDADEAKAKKAEAVKEILANDVPSTDPNFKAPVADIHDANGQLVQEGTETMVAVVGGNVVAGVEKLAHLVDDATKNKHNAVGLKRFIERLAAVADKRAHSVEDLLKFIERGDLPIADDGCIVAYKILANKADSKGTFVDCHTRKVPQKVGSHVHMDISLVDPNRRNECSNGLHVARRGYLGGFGGDVCTLIKVAPEDVIAVPLYDANKMRVCGYHIIDLLPNEDFSKLRRDKPITDTKEGSLRLGKALKGDHVGILEHVKIGAQHGGDVTITPVKDVKKAKAAAKNVQTATKRQAKAVTAQKPAHTLDADKVAADKVARDVVAQKAAGGSARAQAAQNYFSAMVEESDQLKKYEIASALMEFKKKAKVSWDKLGLTEVQVAQVVSAAATKPVDFEEPEPVKEAPKKVKAKVASVKTPQAASNDKQKAIFVTYEKVLKGDKKAAAELLTRKKTSKKSWIALGLPKDAGEACEKLLKKGKK